MRSASSDAIRFRPVANRGGGAPGNDGAESALAVAIQRLLERFLSAADAISTVKPKYYPTRTRHMPPSVVGSILS